MIFYKLVIDKPTGSISSLYDKELKQELYDPQNPYKLGQPVRETSEKRDVSPFKDRRSPMLKLKKESKGLSGKV